VTPRAWLIAAGEALYGPRWQSDLALDLGRTYRTVLRWVDGTTPVPADIPEQIGRLLRARRTRIAALERAAVDLPHAAA